MIASKVPNVTMFTGIALRVHELRFSRGGNQPIPDQGGSQSPTEHSGSLVLPTLYNHGNCHTSALEESSLGLRDRSCLDTSFHKVKWECGNPPSNSCDATGEK